MKILLEFTSLEVFDTSVKPHKREIYEMSYRMKKRFKFLDSSGKESILRNEYQDKDGHGYFVNKIDKANLVINVNKLHNNIDLVYDIVDAVAELEKYSTEVANENIMLKARKNIDTLINTAKIMDKTNLLKQTLVKLQDKEIAEEYRKSKDKAKFLEQIIEPPSLENEEKKND